MGNKRWRCPLDDFRGASFIRPRNHHGRLMALVKSVSFHLGAQSGCGRVLWVPSQSGGLAVCLHWHHHTVFFSDTSNFTGCWPVPLWEPLQNGCVAERPHAHHQYSPASISRATGLLSQTTGCSDMERPYTHCFISARRKLATPPLHWHRLPLRQTLCQTRPKSSAICHVLDSAGQAHDTQTSPPTIPREWPTNH